MLCNVYVESHVVPCQFYFHDSFRIHSETQRYKSFKSHRLSEHKFWSSFKKSKSKYSKCFFSFFVLFFPSLSELAKSEFSVQCSLQCSLNFSVCATSLSILSEAWQRSVGSSFSLSAATVPVPTRKWSRRWPRWPRPTFWSNWHVLAQWSHQFLAFDLAPSLWPKKQKNNIQIQINLLYSISITVSVSVYNITNSYNVHYYKI